MNLNILIIMFICIRSKIMLEWTEETLARRPSDFIYDNHFKDMNLPNLGEFSRNAFGIVNLKSPPDLMISGQMVTINVEVKKGEIISKKNPYCNCNIVAGSGFLLCDFQNEDEQFDTVKILDNKENKDIEFTLGNFNTIVEVCNGIYGNNDNGDNNNNSYNNETKTIEYNNPKINPDENSKKKVLSKGELAGIIIGIASFFSIIGFILYKIFKKKKTL